MSTTRKNRRKKIAAMRARGKSPAEEKLEAMRGGGKKSAAEDRMEKMRGVRPGGD